MKTYELRATSDPNLFRVVDRHGEWEDYAHVVDSGNVDPMTATYLRGVTSILHKGYPKYGLMTYLAKATPDVIEKKLKFGQEKGDAVHQFIPQVVAGAACSRRDVLVFNEDRESRRLLTWDEWECIRSWESFCTRHAVTFFLWERAVFHLKLRYAGTLDAILRMNVCCGVKSCPCAQFVGKLLLIDWKSGSGIYDDMGAQVAAYAHAESLKTLLADLKLQGTGIIRLGTQHKLTNGYEAEFYSVPETRANFVDFKQAIRFVSKSRKKKDGNGKKQPLHPIFDPKCIREIPETLNVVIEREVIAV